MSFIDDDLTSILSDVPFFNDASAGGESTRGNLRESDEIITLSDGVPAQVRVTTLLVRTGTLTVGRGDVVTVDGTDYRIDRVSPEMHGTLTRFYLARSP